MLKNQKVNLFIAGAAKSGTTTIYNQLSSHPGVCMSAIKEPNFFTSAALLKDDLYYKEKIITTKESYEELFNPKANQQIIGEASVSYLFYPGTAEKIFSYNPKARIIILLRNPVQRAFSHYLMDKKLGFTEKLFEDIINEDRDATVHSKYFQQFVRYGLYSQQVAEYINIFPSSQVLVILFDDLQQSTAMVLNRITRFLELEDGLNDFTREKFNESGVPNGPLLSYLYRLRPLRKAVKAWMPGIVLKKARKLFFSAPDEELATYQELWLKKYYREDIIQLEKIIKRKLSGWYE